jgi:hypothetical protein
MMTEIKGRTGMVKFSPLPFSAGGFSLQPLCSVQAFSGPAESKIIPGLYWKSVHFFPSPGIE